MRLVIVSDTHVPQRARAVPDALWQAIESADVVIHAGDWNDVSLLDEFEARAARLVAVHGNNDGPALRARLPEVARETIDGIRFAVVHETGSRDGRESRMAAAFPDTDVLVFGHSHIPWDTVARRPGAPGLARRPGAPGLRLLNPGSPTDRRREPRATYLTAVVEGGELRDVTLVPLP